mmetsp:Transcript_13178/g.9241  ORF Transcript_13178/g.9241 Transcript_13178/m.9241 type:complete len:164 (-) Transcript_13178:194-685(-)|eukprot:CAMPEP_0116870230 /NCGR_PEP_ID=MMETSP0463-20121206/96_1 /TAXON_ID=181622 /ORGANISM="Strombidinopsis sp, Strain SopsisLIS2011" /LENGTH=163 /DNA_ID=CAMNT_0004506475 /DNA_START=32 /DNA_END=523 /DNA_ORIENTATION=+
MSDNENEFEVTDSGATTTNLVEAGRLKNGSPVMIKDHPCKVTDFSTAKPGKHGSAKAMVGGKDVFTDKMYTETFGTGDMIPAPILEKTEWTLINLDEDDGTLTLMDQQGDTKEDLNLPTADHLSDVAKNIKRIFEEGKRECLVTVLKWGDKEQVASVREGSEQ